MTPPGHLHRDRDPDHISALAWEHVTDADVDQEREVLGCWAVGSADPPNQRQIDS